MFSGRKPYGLVLSLLIMKTSPETWDEIAEYLKGRLKFETRPSVDGYYTEWTEAQRRQARRWKIDLG
jgi:hypothetical protein